jgi:hypothetical protein
LTNLLKLLLSSLFQPLSLDGRLLSPIFKNIEKIAKSLFLFEFKFNFIKSIAGLIFKFKNSTNSTKIVNFFENKIKIYFELFIGVLWIAKAALVHGVQPFDVTVA